MQKTPKYHVLTCSHVVAPWKWPKLYPDEWLRHVNEKHTHYTIEMRYDHGVFINQGDLHPKVYHHSSRDLAAMHIEMEDDIVELYMGLDLETELDILSEKSSYYPLKVGQVCTSIDCLETSFTGVTPTCCCIVLVVCAESGVPRPRCSGAFRRRPEACGCPRRLYRLL